MNPSEKIKRAAAVMPEFGRKPALRVLGLPRSTWSYRQAHGKSEGERHAPLRVHRERIAREHPEYGYRRSTAEIAERLGRAITHKVIQKLQGLGGLALLRRVRPPRPSAVRQRITAVGERANLVAARQRIAALEVFYTDFTELI